MPARKILIVYFSRTGTTRRVAQSLASALEGSLDEITETHGRAGLGGYLRSVWEATRKQPAHILPAKLDPASFDLVVIGTPIWAWSVSSPVRAYLTANKERLPDVAFFCTMGGKGNLPAFAQMRDVAGKSPLAVYAVKASDAAVIAGDPAFAAFVQTLKNATPKTNAA